MSTQKQKNRVNLTEEHQIQVQRLWANLAEHLFGIAVHDLTSIRKQLKLSTGVMNSLPAVAEDVSLLVGTVSTEQLREARKLFNEFKTNHPPNEILHSSQLKKTFDMLQKNVAQINEGRRRLKRYQKEYPLLFQDSQHREGFGVALGGEPALRRD
ncbi:hypothetical protein SH668x_001730 [Planctomicrobium sp. SH668]|uniref:hypothetical protein n=1 Tax=Planctomicrobium sp. SH668 TaxID=3448126 RepID=UPI003F5B0CC0